MKLLLAIAVAALAGCANPGEYREVGPYTSVSYTVPSCSQVTVSTRVGSQHWFECEVR